MGLFDSITEVPGKPHFWDAVFREEPVASIIEELVASPRADISSESRYTFTIIWPSESGSMRGWQVRELGVPGR